MKQISTQEPAKIVAQKSQKQELFRCEPRKSTIDFIKQFARAYQHQPQLHSSLSGLFVN
ncbi:MAG: hypothetical protein IJC40_02915 [Muribaculaceae bacterium]|jgi:hypothetical protein|nr:hypothetical protein [Muribaculaceae bacterium]